MTPTIDTNDDDDDDDDQAEAEASEAKALAEALETLAWVERYLQQVRGTR